MDEKPEKNGPDEVFEEEPFPLEEDDEPKSKPKPKAQAEPPALDGLSTGKEPWKGSGCGGRLRLYLGILALAAMVAMLIAGASIGRRLMWANFEGKVRAVVQNLPPDLAPGEINRTRRNLDRFRAMLERVDEPHQQMGEFVRRVDEFGADGRLTADEVERLNLMLEQWIEDSGIPVIQLGALDTSLRVVDPLPGAGGNSEFRIPNSEFA
jgi:hypothetical protein